MNLTTTDRTLLNTLALKVRTASLPQVGQHFYGSVPLTRRRVGMLEQMGLVETYTLLAATPELPTAPLIVWSPGDPLPNFGRLAYVLATRWSKLELQAVKCVIATRRFAGSVGGQGGRKSRPAEGTHDLCLTSLYLAQSPERQEQWRAEEAKSQRGLKKPDATIVAENIAVEMGGSSYTREKLEGLFTWCARREMGIELW
jgi:hypothetical protein